MSFDSFDWSFFPIFGFPMPKYDYPSTPDPQPVEKEEPKFRAMPMNPSVGQYWLNVLTGEGYVWDGQQWVNQGKQTVYVGGSVVGAKTGDFWFY